jgi:hypothetical protein
MAAPKFSPAYPWCVVVSLEDEAEENAEAGPGDELELCQLVAVCHECSMKPGQTVLVQPAAYHYADRYEDALFVPMESIRTVVNEK